MKSSTANAFWIVLSLLAGGVLAQPTLQPNDFAVGFPLRLQGGYGAYRLELDERVYREATNPRLDDLRVFDARGTAQPHVLDLPRPATVEEELRLPLFPLHSRSSSGPPREVRVETDARGTVVRVLGGAAGPERPRLWGYLLDLQAIAGRPARIVLDWAPLEQGFVARVALEGSDDLATWRPLGRAALAELVTQGQRIVRNTLELPNGTPRFLRFAWPEEAQATQVEHAVAVLRKDAPAAPLRWLEPAAAADAEGGWRYDAGGPFPVRRLVVLLAEGGLATVRVESRAANSGPWVSRYRGLVYRLRIDGEALNGEPVPVETSDRYWRVVVEQTWGSNGGAPRLRLGWRPHRLRFSAGGEPPYLLAVGSVRAGAVAVELQRGFRSLVEDLPESAFGKASLGDPLPLGGAAARTLPEPPRELPWRTWVLWGVLAAGVLGVASMVRSLVREMSR